MTILCDGCGIPAAHMVATCKVCQNCLMIRGARSEVAIAGNNIRVQCCCIVQSNGYYAINCTRCRNEIFCSGPEDGQICPKHETWREIAGKMNPSVPHLFLTRLSLITESCKGDAAHTTNENYKHLLEMLWNLLTPNQSRLEYEEKWLIAELWSTTRACTTRNSSVQRQQPICNYRENINYCYKRLDTNGFIPYLLPDENPILLGALMNASQDTLEEVNHGMGNRQGWTLNYVDTMKLTRHIQKYTNAYEFTIYNRNATWTPLDKYQLFMTRKAARRIIQGTV